MELNLSDIASIAQEYESGKDYRLYDYYPSPDKKPKDDISTTSKILAGLFAIAHAADWAQTQHISRNPDKYYEKEVGGIIGRHPSEGRVNSFMVAEGMAKGLLPFMLPSGYREAAQAAFLGGKLKVINQNKNIGIGLNF